MLNNFSFFSRKGRKKEGREKGRHREEEEEEEDEDEEEEDEVNYSGLF